MWAGAAATGSPLPGAPAPIRNEPLNPDVAEHLVVQVLIKDVGPHISDAVATLCGPSGINKAPTLAERVTDILRHDDDVVKAARAMCECSSAATVACFRTRTMDAWMQRHADFARCSRVLLAECASKGVTVMSLLDVAVVIRRCRRMRRCALYALRAIEAASLGEPPIRFGSTDLDALEAWASAYRAASPKIHSFALDLGVATPPTDRLLPVVLNAMNLPRMTRDQMVAIMKNTQPAADGTFASVATLYQAPSTTTAPSKAQATQAINGMLTFIMLQAMAQSDSASDASYPSIDGEIDIFAAYPGTRAGICRHWRNAAASTTADIGIYLVVA
ncbi:Cobalamin adenosyltransferase incomplete domain containing protein [Pandoravirus macleodensis]|uniref:Cobalamin adenosyltransferase incomplete domain containing protein n=1 Tax=Pandoravirus macleodensis TaxID=2107707 RepID=A0A2U7UFH0_9VIRU|nr:Cobalamin adenosyltransferase incomplete domain containing protein [Pandoravirus macleodensis]AVK77050.1 Cobalamin adenosyltransferase incomplete domain containing protein [Pandoravirus macleodensis]